MAHKTFISYKYSEARDLRDKILLKLGSDATYYRGETSNSPDLTDLKTTTIRRCLADMIYDTSVMIVIISPNMRNSKWMEWEIKYALREQSRNGRISHINGIICVVQKEKSYTPYSAYGLAYYDFYSWAKFNGDWAMWYLFDIIKQNRNNKKFSHPTLSQHYIDIVTEDEFLRQPLKYIEEAYYKSQHTEYYDISKQGSSIW